MSLPFPLILQLFTIGIIVAIAAIMAAMPAASHPDIYFAITVAPSWRQSDEARRIARRFRLALLVHTIVASLLVLALGRAPHLEALTPLFGTAWILVGAFLAFSRARGAVQPHAVEPSMEREAVLQPRPAHLPGGWIGQLLPFVLLLATAFYLKARWADIPARFAVHWGVDGRPNGWAPRTTPGVFLPLLIGVAICLFLTMISLTIARARRIYVSGAAGLREARFRVAILRFGIGTELMLALLMSAMACLPLRANPDREPPVLALILPIVAGIALGSIALIRAARSETPLGAAAPGAANDERPIGDRTLDRYWKGGLFYVNRDDPALLVEKRFGIGYTFNFGNPRAWLSLVALLVVVALAIVLPRLL